MDKNSVLEMLKNDVKIADKKFQEAKGESVNSAIYELMCAEEKLRLFIIKSKAYKKNKMKNH